MLMVWWVVVLIEVLVEGGDFCVKLRHRHAKEVLRANSNPSTKPVYQIHLSIPPIPSIPAAHPPQQAANPQVSNDTIFRANPFGTQTTRTSVA
ncbi:uncharacterized protein Bfra_004443 [Botrytis fragariae]|uniref:Secreted protein n=1 Tax=Botrytis fragariae TaxID=1964551 RepID=A0A8H6AVF4_9HELO|nr:uncharacterized protein Bfra_004443 [Botrytis fragariae]KAF5874436.1 hypothetical protein Bfra_004443 [Botrytis fragariae]